MSDGDGFNGTHSGKIVGGWERREKDGLMEDGINGEETGGPKDKGRVKESQWWQGKVQFECLDGTVCQRVVKWPM